MRGTSASLPCPTHLSIQPITHFRNVFKLITSNTNQKFIDMPVHPSEEEAPAGLTEKIAKDPSSLTSSTASDHESHDNEHTPLKASTQDIQSKGPQIPLSMDGQFLHNFRVGDPSNPSRADMPPKTSKDELKARAEELNK